VQGYPIIFRTPSQGRSEVAYFNWGAAFMTVKLSQTSILQSEPSGVTFVAAHVFMLQNFKNFAHVIDFDLTPGKTTTTDTVLSGTFDNVQPSSCQHQLFAVKDETLISLSSPAWVGVPFGLDVVALVCAFPLPFLFIPSKFSLAVGRIGTKLPQQHALVTKYVVSSNCTIAGPCICPIATRCCQIYTPNTNQFSFQCRDPDDPDCSIAPSGCLGTCGCTSE
jgi:hypothetical protein